MSITPIGELAADFVTLINSNVSLLIEDNDGSNMMVYFEETAYTATEGIDESVEVCIVIEGERSTPVTVMVFTVDGSARG